MSNFKIINADVLVGLKSLPSESVDCVFTSPPYWGLRDYGVEGELVLDPFVGSGTTCIASQLMGRDSIGIELSEEYFEIAKARVKQYQEQQRLF